MQCKSDAIKMQERAWGENPGTMPTYLSRPCRAKLKVAVALGLGLGVAVRRRWRGRRRRGKERPEDQAVQVAGQRGVIGPTQNQNIRSRVGQATTTQRDWQATLKAHETRQNASQRSHFPFQPSPCPCMQLFPRLSILSARVPVSVLGSLGVWLVWVLACQQLHQLPALQQAMFAFLLMILLGTQTYLGT